MKEFNLLNNAEESFYCGEIYVDEFSGEDLCENEQQTFSRSTKQKFLQEVRNQSITKKQAGYSKTRNCEFISLILIRHNSGDGAFYGHSIEKTYIIKSDNKIKDAYDNENEYGEVGWHYRAAYHVLPDGKLLEFKLNQSYEKELAEIYEMVSKTRFHYELETKTPTKDSNNSKKNKI